MTRWQKILYNNYGENKDKRRDPYIESQRIYKLLCPLISILEGIGLQQETNLGSVSYNMSMMFCQSFKCLLLSFMHRYNIDIYFFHYSIPYVNCVNERDTYFVLIVPQDAFYWDSIWLAQCLFSFSEPTKRAEFYGYKYFFTWNLSSFSYSPPKILKSRQIVTGVYNKQLSLLSR